MSDLELLNLLDEWDRYAGDSPEYRDSPFAQRVNEALVARGRRMLDRAITPASSEAMLPHGIAHNLLMLGACQDCGAPVSSFDEALAHAARDGFACADYLGSVDKEGSNV